MYDLEIVEEKGVRDWLSPPDNRHLFLKEAKEAFTIKENVEAKKQVRLDTALTIFLCCVVVLFLSLRSLCCTCSALIS